MNNLIARLRTAALLMTVGSVAALAGEPYGLESRAPVRVFLNNNLPPVQPEAGDWKVVRAFPGLAFPDPVGLVPEPGRNRLVVYCRQGQIYLLENDPETTQKTLLLDISARTQGWDDCGLMGLAFHPQFNQPGSTDRGYFYVFYQYTPSPQPGPDRPPTTKPTYNRLARFTVRDGASTADPNSELVLIDQYDRSVWHNGGAMLFHPDDGFLYLSLGDEGGKNAEYGNTQRLDKGLFSGVIRIDVDQDPAKGHPIRRRPQTSSQAPSRTANYFIPNDNPFLDPTGGMLEEFWCIGLRSPHRMSFDPVAKTIWLGDVGQEEREEINVIEKGGNYQWAYKEGTIPGPVPAPDSILGTERPPIYEYPHRKGENTYDGDNCVIGGYVYRGRQHAEKLGGKYIFGDNGSGRLWALSLQSNTVPAVVELGSMPAGFGYSGLSSFGVDRDGEIYLCQMGPAGQIFKLAQREISGPAPPALLSQTGAFRNLATLTPAAELIPYDVNSPLWSDAAIKTRWMAVPNDGPPYLKDEQIGFAPAAEWSFPDGTVFVKHFELPIDDADPSARRRLETRFLVRDTNGVVYGLTYKWRPDHSEADLLPGSFTEDVTIKTTTPVGTFGQSQDIGGALPGTTTLEPGQTSYSIRATGGDIWGAADQFRFVHQQRTGDFDIKVRVESLTATSLYTKAGLMARESLSPQSRHVFALVFPDNQARFRNAGGYEFDYRAATAGPSDAIYPPVPQPRVDYPNTWVRLKRRGNEFTAYASGDGVSWTKCGAVTLALPTTIYFGMAVSAQNDTVTATARFTDFAENRGQTWYYPSRKDCLACHTPAAGHVLGVKASQLNGSFAYPETGRRDDQLRVWNHLGLFNPPLDEASISGLPKLVPIDAAAASLEERVRSYLAVNCAQCHRPGGVRANFDARHETPPPRQSIVNGAVNKTLEIVGARVVSPQALAKSILYQRMNSLEEIKMPPLARNTIDTSALATVAEWINRLPPPDPTLGLRGEYFDNMDLTGLMLVRTDETVNFDWGLGSPDVQLGADTFSIRWSGQIQARFSEEYAFYTTSDDGVRLWVNDKLLVDNWTYHAPSEDRGTLTLTAGQKYPLRLEYFESGIGSVIRLEWESLSQPRELIPPSQLSLPPDATPSFPPPLLSRSEMPGTGQFRFWVEGKAVGNYDVQASTNLQDWTTLKTFMSTNGLWLFLDPQGTNFRHRFYRARGSR